MQDDVGGSKVARDSVQRRALVSAQRRSFRDPFSGAGQQETPKTARRGRSAPIWLCRATLAALTPAEIARRGTCRSAHSVRRGAYSAPQDSMQSRVGAPFVVNLVAQGSIGSLRSAQTACSAGSARISLQGRVGAHFALMWPLATQATLAARGMLKTARRGAHLAFHLLVHGSTGAVQGKMAARGMSETERRGVHSRAFSAARRGAHFAPHLTVQRPRQRAEACVGGHLARRPI